MKVKVFMGIALFFLCAPIFSQTTGELQVSVTTSETGGRYAPRNVVAIWIEDNAGNFIKTLAAYADRRITHLNTWQQSTTEAGSEFNDFDAITGATRSNHGLLTCNWNSEDYNGNATSDGEYKVCMELTDKNSTGNYSSFVFTKGETEQDITPNNAASFSSISIHWIPESTVGIFSDKTKPEISIFPNPGNGKIVVIGNNIKEIEILKITGQKIFATRHAEFDLSNLKNGIYLISVRTEEGHVIKKYVKE